MTVDGTLQHVRWSNSRDEAQLRVRTGKRQLQVIDRDGRLFRKSLKVQGGKLIAINLMVGTRDHWSTFMKRAILLFVIVMAGVQVSLGGGIPELERRLAAGADAYQDRLTGLAAQADRELAGMVARLKKNQNAQSLDFIQRIETDRKLLNQIFDFPLYLSRSLLKQVVIARDKQRRVINSVQDAYAKDTSGARKPQS